MELSELKITKEGILCEVVEDYHGCEICYPVTGIVDHYIYGLFFLFGRL
jgi:hypothetical protein